MAEVLKQPKTDQITKQFPDDVLIDIFLRLPVRSLFLFRSVSKHWLTLIQNPLFISLHTTNNHHDEPLLIVRTLESESKLKTRNIVLTLLSDDETLPYKSEVALEVLSPSMADRGLGLKEDKLLLMGPCNGVFCLTDTVDVVLFNPATRECRNVTASPLSSQIDTSGDVIDYFDPPSFGFDCVRNDYKVVRFYNQDEFDYKYDDDIVDSDDVVDDDDEDDDDGDSFDDDDVYTLDYDDSDGDGDGDGDGDVSLTHYYKVEIFSLSTNSWIELHSVVSPFNINRICSHSFFFNGAFHWLGGEEDDDQDICAILVFDLNKEAFDRFDLPTGYCGYDLYNINLLDLNESLALVLQWKTDVLDLNVEIEIWAMKDYGIDTSWRKLYNIEFDLGIERPLAFGNKVEFLIENDRGRLGSYDLETRAIKEFEVHGVKGSMHAFRYKESLVSLK